MGLNSYRLSLSKVRLAPLAEVKRAAYFRRFRTLILGLRHPHNKINPH